MNKPKSFYDVADALFEPFRETRLERVEYVEKTVRGFDQATLRFAAECAKEYPELAVENSK